MPFKLAIKLLIYIRMRIMIRVKKKKKIPFDEVFSFFHQKNCWTRRSDVGSPKGE